MASCCPNCRAAVRAQARYCSICGVNLGEGGFEDSYRSVLIESTYPDPNWREAPEVMERLNAPLVKSRRAPLPHIGRYHDAGLVMLLPFVTFGLYTLYWWWRAGREIRLALQSNEPQPWRDLFLLIITAGWWRLLMHYNYAARITELQERADLPCSHYLKYLCPLLSLCFLGFVSIGLLQSELNKIWEACDGRP